MQVPWLKYIASYFYLVTVKKIPSDINPGLCLQMEAGKLLLNTANANYSYGNLHKVFEEVFEIIEIEKKPPENVLILGLGTGSIIDILQRQYGFNPKITGVEIDKAVIDSMQYWAAVDLEQTEIICGDAVEVVKSLEPGFDLIIVDLFIDLDVYSGIHNKEFIEQIKYLLKNEGRILINYVVNNKTHKEQFAEFQILLMNCFTEIKGHPVMGMNRVLELIKT